MTTGRALLVAVMVVGALPVQGCTVGLALLGAAAGTVAGTGTAYTLDGIAQRTFTAPLEEVRQAAGAAFARMELTVASDEGTAEERQIRARAGDRAIRVTLYRLTANLTRLRVTATHHLFLHDRSTAGEIVTQVENALSGAPTLSRKAPEGGMP